MTPEGIVLEFLDRESLTYYDTENLLKLLIRSLKFVALRPLVSDKIPINGWEITTSELTQK